MGSRWTVVLGLAVACGPSGAEGGGSTTSECDACVFEALVGDGVGASEQTPMDCGTIELEDGIDAWQAAHDCVLAAAGAETAVVVRWRPSSIDSVPYSAIVGAVGESYAITWIDWDCYQGDVMASQHTCNGLAAQTECTLGMGSFCVECLGAGEPAILCE